VHRVEIAKGKHKRSRRENPQLHQLGGPKRDHHGKTVLSAFKRPPPALRGWDAAAERRDAQDEFHSAAQARAWADGDFDADRGFAFDGVGRPAH
jgi:hypothetical protein